MQRYRLRSNSAQNPTMPDRGATIWLKNTAKQHFWRVVSWYELGDLIQDGYLSWFIVQDRYPGLHYPGHIMRLFQVTYLNRIHDLSKRRTRNEPEVSFHRFSEEAVEQISNMLPCEFADLLATMAEMRPDLAECVRQLISNPKFSKPYRVKLGEGRETLNDRLCKVLQVDPEANDLAGELRQALAVA